MTQFIRSLALYVPAVRRLLEQILEREARLKEQIAERDKEIAALRAAVADYALEKELILSRVQRTIGMADRSKLLA